MHIEITIDRSHPLSANAIETLLQAFTCRLTHSLPDITHQISIRYASAPALCVEGEDKNVVIQISKILQQTLECTKT